MKKDVLTKDIITVLFLLAASILLVIYICNYYPESSEPDLLKFGTYLTSMGLGWQIGNIIWKILTKEYMY